MRAWFSKVAVLIIAGIWATTVPRAQAETQTEDIVAEMRTYLYLQIAPNTVQSFLPSGWASSPVANGPAKDANFVVLFLDRKLGLTPDGKPLQAGTNRLLVLIVPSKNAKTGEVANMIVGGYSTDPLGSPGAYTAMTRSFGPASSPAAASNPASRMSALFDGVPIISAAFSTPACVATARDTRISATESR